MQLYLSCSPKSYYTDVKSAINTITYLCHIETAIYNIGNICFLIIFRQHSVDICVYDNCEKKILFITLECL